MKKSWFGIGLAVALGAVDCFAAAPVFDTEDGKYTYEFPYYVVDTPAGASNTLASAAFAITKYESAEDEGATISYADLLEAASGTIVKTGAGTLEIAAALPNWEGRIHVMAGTLYSHGIGTLGKNLSTGSSARALETDATFVHNGATIYRKPTAGGALLENDRKMIVIEGTGVDGRGALVADSPNSNETTWPLGFDLVLTGDATIRNARSGWALKTSWAPSPGQKFTLNGHTLTILGDASNTGSAFLHNHTPITAGHIVASNLEYRLYGNAGKLHYQGGASNTLTFTGGSILDFNGAFNGVNTHWTIVAEDMKYVQPTGLDAFQNGTTKHVWVGPVNLVNDLPLYCSFNSLATVGFAGYIYGPGGFPLYKGQKNLDFHLSCPSNAFKGPVGINSGKITLHNPGALPEDCAVLTVTNGALVLEAASGFNTFRLPPVEFSGTGVVENLSSDYTDARFSSLKKSGNGNLSIQVRSAISRLDIEGGTVTLDFPVYCPNAGFIFGESGNLGNASGVANNRYVGNPSYSPIIYTNATVLSVHKAYEAGMSIPKSNCGTYAGWMWNNSSETVNWTFAFAQNQGMAFCFDRSLKMWDYSFAAYKRALFRTVSVSPGPHFVEFRIYGSQGTGGGPVDGNVLTNCTWKNQFGIAWDPQGRDSRDCADYIEVSDPGDGSVVTTSDTVERRVLAFDSIRGAPGTALAVTDAVPIDTANLEGVTSVSNCPAFTVTDGWTGDAAVIAGGGALTCDGELAFGDAATFAVTESRHQRNSPAGGWTMAEAEGGISLPSDWQSRVSLPSGKYRLSLSGDGKRLMLEHFNGTIFTIR